MIKVNSKVIIKELSREVIGVELEPATMIVEGLYWKAIKDSTEVALPILSKQDEEIDQLNQDVYMKCAKCLWYNTRNELQSAFINLELLTEL